ncbi:uncharacterized protein BDW43DRAFT_46628 [Aspergillus alliaceus]|uniref:uncharacterized protein n=1 Tax=Petromyces alliaceus TaxID=209559 RepID=UPI0012A59C34|nr:uncharacterized protein BDW43DRAFT_46628 [Aspergillus alliaceus]KAB8234915.1 hypothetical protein BDW43DRAFT_46628 [Aspergillus alliaceus]
MKPMGRTNSSDILYIWTLHGLPVCNFLFLFSFLLYFPPSVSRFCYPCAYSERNVNWVAGLDDRMKFPLYITFYHLWITSYCFLFSFSLFVFLLLPQALLAFGES